MGRRTAATLGALVTGCLLAACGAQTDGAVSVASQQAPSKVAPPSLRVESLTAASGSRLVAPPLPTRATRARTAAPLKAASATAARQRQVAIYAAVIRKEVGPGRQRIYLFDAPAGRGRTVDETKPGKRFDAQFRAGLSKALADLGPLQFVRDTDDGRTADGVRPRKGGVVVTLGAIVGKGDKVQVTSRSWCGNVCGSQTTWLVKRAGTGWKVTGRTGPYVVS